MDLETITTTAGNHAPLSTAHMAATHPQQHAQVREPRAVRHVHRVTPSYSPCSTE